MGHDATFLHASASNISWQNFHSLPNHHSEISQCIITIVKYFKVLLTQLNFSMYYHHSEISQCLITIAKYINVLLPQLNMSYDHSDISQCLMTIAKYLNALSRQLNISMSYHHIEISQCLIRSVIGKQLRRIDRRPFLSRILII